MLARPVFVFRLCLTGHDGTPTVARTRFSDDPKDFQKNTQTGRFPHVERPLVPIPLRRPHRRCATTARAPRSTSSRRSSGPSGRPSPTIRTQLLDFGIGENDDMAPESSGWNSLKTKSDKVENRGYADNGIAALQGSRRRVHEAAVRRHARSGDRSLPLHRHRSPLYAMLPACFINPGDVTLMTVPGYPVAGTWTKYLGGEVHRLPLRKENGFFPDLDGIPRRHQEAGQAARHQLPEQPDRGGGDERLLQAGRSSSPTRIRS